VHLIVALLKRWLLGTHQGAVSRAYLGYYLDEFAFRFNRRKSRSRGKLFYRLLEQAVNTAPVPSPNSCQCQKVRQRLNHKRLGLHESSVQLDTSKSVGFTITCARAGGMCKRKASKFVFLIEDLRPHA
jgi:hypothetical protein